MPLARSHTRSLTKSMLGLLFVCAGAISHAQDLRVYQLRYVEAGGMDQFVQKHVIQVVRDLDLKGSASFDQDQLKVRLDASIGGEELLNALNGLDLGTFEFATVVGSSFPVKIDTGEPAADESTYNAAKEAWIEEHPDEYLQMQEPNGNSSSEIPINDE